MSKESIIVIKNTGFNNKKRKKITIINLRAKRAILDAKRASHKISTGGEITQKTSKNSQNSAGANKGQTTKIAKFFFKEQQSMESTANFRKLKKYK